MNRNRRVSSSLCLLGALALAGCNSGPETVPVYGKVTFVGRENPYECRLFFRPSESNGIVRPVMATPNSDGDYETRAFRDVKGLVPGTYQVGVTYFDLKPGAKPDRESSFNEFEYDAGELVVEQGSRGIEFNIEVPKET